MRGEVALGDVAPFLFISVKQVPHKIQHKKYSEPRLVSSSLNDPGFEVDLYITVDLRTLTAVWLGDTPLDKATRAGAMVLHGPRTMIGHFKKSLKLSLFAAVERQAEG